jgi:hypothetical protein
VEDGSALVKELRALIELQTAQLEAYRKQFKEQGEVLQSVILNILMSRLQNFYPSTK